MRADDRHPHKAAPRRAEQRQQPLRTAESFRGVPRRQGDTRNSGWQFEKLVHVRLHHRVSDVLKDAGEELVCDHLELEEVEDNVLKAE